MKILKVAVPSAILLTGILLNSVQSFATPAFAKKEGQKCTACHVGMGKKELNDTGKCYKEHNHSLAECSTKK